MEAYQYKAVDKNGKFHKGKLDAVNSADLEARLSRLNLELVNYKKPGSPKYILFSPKITRRDLITFSFHIEQTSRAGIPILESLEDLKDSVDKQNLRDVIVGLIESIEGGKTLTGSLEKFPNIFNSTFCSLVNAGELSGEISQVFFNIGEDLKWQDEQTAHLKKLFMYPLFASFIVTGVIFFLMIYLVPELLSFVNMMGQEIPFHTRALIFMSNLFIDYWYIILVIPVVLFIFIHIFLKASIPLQHKFDELKLKIPFIGNLLRKLILARLSGYIAMMYGSGINIVECIKTGEQIVGNLYIKVAVHNVGQFINEGISLSKSFEMTGLFPPLVIRMIKVGESTGSLEESLLNVKYFYNRDVKNNVERLQTIIEPVITVFLGIIIGWVMLSVIGPIYDLVSQINI